MPSENSGKPGSNTRAVAAKAPVSSNKGEGSKAASTIAKSVAKANSQNVKEGRIQDSKKQGDMKATLNLYKDVGSHFKGARVDPYLDKDGKVTTISTSSGPSGGPALGTDDAVSEYTITMPPTPEPVAPITPAPVRTPTRNVTNISDLVPQFSPEHIAKILFENMSAIELSIVERHDTIEGINQRYSIISNLSEVTKKYNAAKQLSIMDKSKPLTSIYAINIQDKIPQEDYLILQDLIPKKGYTTLEGLSSTYQYLDENNQLVTREKGYYYIDTNGDLVIELINLERSQEVEVYIDTNGTIYKVES